MTTELSSLRLETGDRLPRAEFHRRYCLRPDVKRAELVQGVVYVASPTRYRDHDAQHSAVVLWLGTYAVHHPGVQFGNSPTLYLGDEDEVQPDGLLFRVPPPDTDAARVTDDGYIEGVPQLVVEVAASSAAYDLRDKLRMYQRTGVAEYIVWRVLDTQIDWFVLEQGVYARQSPDDRGILVSRGFAGLRLQVPKMLSGDYAGVLAELQLPPS